jgi:hypothetical protein
MSSSKKECRLCTSNPKRRVSALARPETSRRGRTLPRVIHHRLPQRLSLTLSVLCCSYGNDMTMMQVRVAGELHRDRDSDGDQGIDGEGALPVWSTCLRMRGRGQFSWKRTDARGDAHARGSSGSEWRPGGLSFRHNARRNHLLHARRQHTLTLIADLPGARSGHVEHDGEGYCCRFGIWQQRRREQAIHVDYPKRHAGVER